MTSPAAPVVPLLAPARWRLRATVTLAALAILAVRCHGWLANPQFWAEDGALFFIQAEHRGDGWSLLFEPYQGYLHFLPRLIVALGHRLPLVAVPAFYVWSAFLITGFVAWFIQSPRVRLPGAWVAALAITAVPHTGEVYLNLTNLQWITAVALFALALADDATTGRQRAGDLALLLAVGLSGPFVVLALPLFAWRAWQRRSAWSYLLLVLAGTCACAHAPAWIGFHQPGDPGPRALWHFGAVVSRRLFVAPLAGTLSLPIALGMTAGAAALVLLTWGLWRLRVAVPGGLALLAAALLLVTATCYRTRVELDSLDELANGDRYFYTTRVLLFWVTAALACAAGPRLRRALTALLVLPLIVNARRFVYPPCPDLHWHDHAARIERGERHWVPILPEGSSFEHPGRPPPRTP